MIGNYALVIRAGGVIAATVAIAIALALLLAFLKFDQRLQEVTVARLGLVVEEVQRQSETGLALGLELAELEDLSAVLPRAARARNVLHIDILGGQGSVLFSSAADRIGSRADRVGLVADASGRFRRRIQGHELLLTTPLINGFGQMVGDVAVYADLTPQHEELLEVRRELLSSTLPVIAGALLLTLVAVILTVRFSGRVDGRNRYPAPHYPAGTDLKVPSRRGGGRLLLRISRERVGNQKKKWS